MSENVRLHVWVKGRVQGVAFRAFVQKSAIELGVVGWVRNVGYDTVETIGEGPREQLETFLKIVKRGPLGSRVDEAREEWEKISGEFVSFRVKTSR